MIIDANTKLPPQVACDFIIGNIYMHKENRIPGHVYLATSVAGHQVLISIRNGQIWSLNEDSPFGLSGAKGWIDVTQSYKVVSI